MPSDYHDILTTDDELWAKAVQRETVIRPLAQQTSLSADDVAFACDQLGIKKTVLYQLIKQYRQDSRASSLVYRKSGRAEGFSPLSSQADDLIEKVIRQSFLTPQKISVAQLHRLVAVEARKVGLAPPSRNAVEFRVKKVGLAVSLAAREGPKVARDKTQPIPGEFIAERPLQIVQVDHTLVDVIVVDEVHRLPIQRPWLTLLIDVATRVVVGYFLTLEAPSSTSVAMALQHAVLPKERWLADLGITAPWPVHGLPETLHMDNAKEFHAKALLRGASEYGIKIWHRPLGTPHYGGHIERLIGTMMGKVHLLPGTTFSSIAKRGSYDSERHATMTLKDIDHWLAIEISGTYHHKVHRKLGRPPLAVWNERVGAGTVPLRLPEDREHFYCDLLPYEERRVRRDGIHLFGIKYWDNVLTFWAGRSKQKFAVRYDPRDLSRIFVQSPEGGFWPVGYANAGYPPVSLWEWKAAQKQLKEQGRAERDEEMLFHAIEAQRLLVEEASHKTKSARRQQQRRIEAHGTVQTLPPPEKPRAVENEQATESEAAVEPFEIEEWS